MAWKQDYVSHSLCGFQFRFGSHQTLFESMGKRMGARTKGREWALRSASKRWIFGVSLFMGLGVACVQVKQYVGLCHGKIVPSAGAFSAPRLDVHRTSRRACCVGTGSRALALRGKSAEGVIGIATPTSTVGPRARDLRARKVLAS